MLALPHVKMAALIADKFQIDPVNVVLKSTFTDWAIRSACYRYIREKEEAEAKKQAAAANRGGRRTY